MFLAVGMPALAYTPVTDNEVIITFGNDVIELNKIA